MSEQLNNNEQNPSLDTNETPKVKTTADDFDYLLKDDFLKDTETNLEDEPPVYRKASKAKAKRVKKVKSFVWVIVIFAVSILLAFTILLFACEYLGIGFGKGGECTVEIDKGMSTSQIANELEQQGAITSPLLFRIYTKLAGYDGSYKYGVYNFPNELGYKDIARMLQTEGAKAESVTVTIPEQSSMDDIMKILEENGVCTKSDFRNAVKNGSYDFDFVDQIPVSEVHYKFEGYLFPDTYDFYCYDSKECAELAIRKMLQNLDSKLTEEVREQIKNSGYTIHEILTMASVVELEASASTKDMPNVAAVFFNRLESPNWQGPRRLESDPTMKYPYGSGRYNTYQTEGLPPGPLCAPSESAILAAANPTKNFSATYFVTDKDMNFYYNNSLSGHRQTINKLKSQGLWYVE